MRRYRVKPNTRSPAASGCSLCVFHQSLAHPVNHGRAGHFRGHEEKELVGDFKNAGREWRPKGDFEDVRVHDFLIKELGRAVPYGVYDLAANKGFCRRGRRRRYDGFRGADASRLVEVGSIKYSNAKRLVITADGGGSNGSRVRLWKLELQRLADELGLDIEVHHFPPGTSKWNKACPREGGDRASPVLVRHDELASASFGQLPSHRRVDLLHDHRNRTESPLRTRPQSYPRGVTVTDDQMASLNLARADFHGEWDYTIKPHPTATNL